MVRVESDHVNWILIVILVAMSLLLAMVSSTGYGFDRQGSSKAASGAVQENHFNPMTAQSAKEVRTPSEAWFVARELYRAGKIEGARAWFEVVVRSYPHDPAARLWAGMVAYRAGDQAAAVRQWSVVWTEAGDTECTMWSAVALAAAELDLGHPDRAARYVIPFERGDYGSEWMRHPVVSFYAALVYEQLAIAAPKYRDAVEESLAEKFSPALAANDGSQWVSPNSHAWLIFLTKQALQRTIGEAWSIDRAAPMVPERATVEPSFAPTVQEFLEGLGSADFASQARGKLKALRLYESPPRRIYEKLDGQEYMIKRGQFIA